MARTVVHVCLSLLGSVFCVALSATTARIREEMGARDTLARLASRAPAVFVAEACTFPPTWEDTATRARGHLHHRVRSYTHAHAPQGAENKEPPA